MEMNDNKPKKQRHGCLSAYLIFNVAALFLVLPGTYQQISPLIPAMNQKWPLFLPSLALLGLAQVVGLVGLFLWKRWGFWLLVVPELNMDSIAAIIGIFDLKMALMSIGRISVLYLALQIGKPNGWDQLE